MRTGDISSLFSIANATFDIRTAQTRGNVFFIYDTNFCFPCIPSLLEVESS